MSSDAWLGSAPGRVNLIGEHVDYLGGQVLPAAVDRRVTVRGRPSREWAVSSRVAGGESYLRALATELEVGAQAVEIESEVPPGAGLSSSAALLVAAAAGLRPGLGGVAAALACQRAEQRATGVQVGVMDPLAAALGRRGHALLIDCRTLAHRPVPLPAELRIAVLDSGIRRSLAGTPYNQRRREAEAGMPSRRRHVDSEIERVRRFAAALEEGRVDLLGGLLKASHASLRDDFEVSTPEVDALVERACAAPGCLGARIMGAGFGGSVLALLGAGSEAGFAAFMAPVPVLFCETADGAFVAGAG